MDIGLRYYLSKDNAVWLDVSELINSNDTSITYSLCTNSFKSAIDTATFTLIGNINQSLRNDAVNYIMGAIENSSVIHAKIEQNGTAIFTGMVDLSSFLIRSAKIEGDFSITLRDVSALYLDDVISKYLFYENYKISEIAKALLNEAGYTVGEIEIEESDDLAIPAFVIDADDNSDTYRDILDSLLFEAGGYVVKANELGLIDIKKIPSSSPSIEPEGISYAISDTLRSSASILDNDGLEVEWSTLAETDEEQSVYVDSSISRSVDEEGNVVGLTIEPEGYFPEDGDITATYQKYDEDLLDREYNTARSRLQNKDLSIICVRDVSAEIICTDENGNPVSSENAWDYPILSSLGMTANPTLYPLKAWYLLRNKYPYNLNLTHFVLHGRVLYRNKVLHTLTPTSCTSPEKYTSEYIFTQEHAEKFAQFYWHFKKYSRIVHIWTEYDYSNRKEGDVVNIAHTGTDIGQPAVIVQKKISFVGSVTKTNFTAVSVGEYNQYPVRNWTESGNNLQHEAVQPLRPRKQWSISSSPDLSGIFNSALIFSDESKTSWFIHDDIGVITSAISESDWLDTCPSNVPDDMYLFCREWNYTTGQWDYYRVTGAPATPARDFSVSFNPSNYYNSKRKKQAFTISVDVTTINLSDMAQIDFSLKTLGVSMEGGIITIPVGVYPESISLDVTVTDLDCGYGPVTKNFSIQGQSAEDGKPMYLGKFATDPDQAAFSYAFIEGDFYWNTETLLAMRYSLNDNDEFYWRMAEQTDSNWSEIMGSISADAFSSIEPGTVTMSQFGYFQNILAQFISADMIEAFEIELKNGGTIRSKGYNKGDIDLASTKTGFLINDLGYSEFQNTRIRNLEATGSFTADALKTINNIPMISKDQLLEAYQADWESMSSEEAGEVRIMHTETGLEGNVSGIVQKDGVMLGYESSNFIGYLVRSADGGNTWSYVNLGEMMVDSYTSGIKVMNSKFVLLVENANSNYYVAVSDDGISYEYYPIPGGYTCYDIAYDGSRYVIVCRYNVDDSPYGLLASSNLSSWAFTRISTATGSSPITKWAHIMHSQNGFITDGEDGFYRIASDFSSYEKIYSLTMPSSSRIFYLETDINLIFFNSSTLGAHILRSEDGITWTDTTLMTDGIMGHPTATLENGVYYYAIGDNTGKSGHKRFFSSANGISWTINTTSYHVPSVAYVHSGIYQGYMLSSSLFYGSLATVQNLYDFYSQVRAKLDTSKVAIPLAEPFAEQRAITGNFTYKGTSYSLDSIRVSDNEIAIRVQGSSEEFLFKAYGIYERSISIGGIVIETISGELRTGNMLPMDPTVNSTIGSADEPYTTGHFKNLNADNLLADKATINGTLNVETIEGSGNIRTTGVFLGKVNTSTNSEDVWGAVFN